MGAGVYDHSMAFVKHELGVPIRGLLPRTVILLVGTGFGERERFRCFRPKNGKGVKLSCVFQCR